MTNAKKEPCHPPLCGAIIQNMADERLQHFRSRDEEAYKAVFLFRRFVNGGFQTVVRVWSGEQKKSCAPSTLNDSQCILLAPKSLHTEKIILGINLCNVIDYIYKMKIFREFICVM